MTYRVIQWATGAMGKSCLRAIIDHPATALVGLRPGPSRDTGRLHRHHSRVSLRCLAGLAGGSRHPAVMAGAGVGILAREVAVVANPIGRDSPSQG